VTNTSITIRALTPADRAAWETLWDGYLSFYKATVPTAQKDLTWSRFHDAAVPMHAHGAFLGGEMVGIVHTIYHYSCWTSEPYCYLQDLFTSEAARGKGVGRALIEFIYADAKAKGANRVHWLTQDTNARAMVLYNDVADKTGFLQYRKIL
jgi:GNAT superfamily N-acetyltransferase